LSVFNGTNPNGVWQLFVFDDQAFNGGEILAGWVLDIEMAAPPVITSHPESQTVAPGSTVTFDVSVAGTPPFGFQWWRNGQVLVPFGTGTDSLTISNVQAANAGSYSVVVSNSVAPGGVVSSNAVLNVTGPMTLVDSPQSQTVAPGTSVLLQVTVAGNPPLNYQWRLNGTLLKDATHSTLALDSLQVADGGSFSVTVWNDDDALTTGPAEVVVSDSTGPPAGDDFADRQPVGGPTELQGVLQGDSSAATIEPGEPLLLGGGKSVWYEWVAPSAGIVTLTLRGSGFDTLLQVFTGSVLSDLTRVTSDDNRGGFYTSALQFNALKGETYLWMIDGYGAGGSGGQYSLSWDLQPTSQRVPVIVIPPQPQQAVAGGTATFSVVTESPEPETYQWRLNDVPIPGAEGMTLAISNVAPGNLGSYSVAVTRPNDLVVRSEPVPLQIGSGLGFIAPGRPPIPNLPPSISVGLGFPGDTTFYSDLAVGDSTELNPCRSPFLRTIFVTVAVEDGGVIQLDTVGSEVFMLLAVYSKVPGIPGAELMACDVVSGTAGQPCRVQYDVPEVTTNTAVIAILDESDGNVSINAVLGAAPPLTNPTQFVAVAHGANHQLEVPDHGWVPAPSIQWQFNGAPIPDATNSTLLFTDFDVTQAGAYSVVLSNFVDTASTTVAHVSQSGPPVLHIELQVPATIVEAVILGSGDQVFALESATALSGPWSAVATNLDPRFPLFYTNTVVQVETQQFFRAVYWPPPEQ
jgi:hypothetical protein